MHETSASRTALVTSLMRAVHARFDRPTLIEDPWGEWLVPESDRIAIQELVTSALDAEVRSRVDGLGSSDAILHAALRINPLYGTVIVRTRYAEDALERAVAHGARQYVIVGAGMDSFALRRPAFARDLEVFEIDHPATQELKRRRLRECAVELPSGLHFIAADLSQEQLSAALTRSPFRNDEPAFFSWLGVTTYLTRDANLATLRAIAVCAVRGSELVFTYLDQRELDPDRQSTAIRDVRARVASMGEPMVSGFDPTELERDLRDVGLTLVEDLGGEELGARYCKERKDGLAPAGTAHIALARVDT